MIATNPRLLAVLFCFPSLVMVGRSSLPLFSIVVAVSILLNKRTLKPMAVLVAIIGVHTFLVPPLDIVLWAGRVLTLIVAFGCFQFLANHPAGFRLLLSHRFHTTVFYLVMPMLLLELAFKLTGSELFGGTIELIRLLVVSELDAANFRNMSVQLFFQEQSFVPYFALYAAAVFRFLGIRRFLLIPLLLAMFHESGTFVLLSPFIIGLLLPRVPLLLWPLMLLSPLVLITTDEFLMSRAERLVAIEEVDDSTLSRVIPFLSAATSLFQHPLGVGIGNYGAAVLDLLEPFLYGPFAAALKNSISSGWLGYKLFEDGRLSYTSQLFGIFIEFGWLAVAAFLVFAWRLLQRALNHEESYHRIIGLLGFIVAFSFSMPIMFPFIYLAAALALRAPAVPRKQFMSLLVRAPHADAIA